MTRSFLIGLALLWASASRADLLWDFKNVDTRPGSTNGIYAYSYPSSADPQSQKTPSHVAKFGRVTSGPGVSNGIPGARLDFVLDGGGYPSAGLGLMFPESQPLDLRELQLIRVHLSSSKSRRVRLSLSSRLEAYQAALDTGVSLGRDTVVGPKGVDWVIQASSLTWPSWVTDVPAVTVDEVLSTTFAIQLNVSCQGPSGKCDQDSGWIYLDSLRLQGVGGAWPTPPQGTGCFGDSTELSQFSSANPNKNGLGGWWYAFTDADAGDSLARGTSKILSALDTNKPETWKPDSILNKAFMRFRVNRQAPYSGFMGLETQFGAPSGDKTKPVTIPDLAAVGFDLAYGTFPPELGGISVHAKKSGRYFGGGAEHQLRLPYDSVPHHWCIDFASLHQPPWSAWQLAFTPEDLLTLSWEVKLQGIDNTALGEFTIRNVKIYRNTGVGVEPVVRIRPMLAHRVANGVLLERPDAGRFAVAALIDASGRMLGRADLAAGASSVLIRAKASGLAWVRYQDAQGAQTIPVRF